MRGAIGAKKREADERQNEQQNKPPGPIQPDSRAGGQKPMNSRADGEPIQGCATSGRGKLGDEWETITRARTAVRGRGSSVDCRGTRNLGGGRERLPAGMIRATNIRRPKMQSRTPRLRLTKSGCALVCRRAAGVFSGHEHLKFRQTPRNFEPVNVQIALWIT